MKKTAIIGASGFIGRNLWQKYKLEFPDAIGTGFSNLYTGLTYFDLCNPNIENLNLEQSGYESVIIASAKPNIAWCEAYPKESYELNVKGTLSLISQLSKFSSINILFLSSDYVFNGEKGNYLDTDELSPNTEYGRQKAEVEVEIPNITQNYTILRLSKVYATTYRDGTLLDSMASNFMHKKKQMVAIDQYFSPTHIDDVVKMILYSQEKNIKKTVNVCYCNQYSRHQIATQLAKAMMVPTSLLESVPLKSIPGMENRPLNTSLICSSYLLHLQPTLTSIKQAIQKVSLNWKYNV